MVYGEHLNIYMTSRRVDLHGALMRGGSFLNIQVK